LLDVLQAFGFGQNWCKWVRGTFRSAMASVLVNGSPSTEFPFHCRLKQGDPLSPYLFILIMESLHMSFSRAVNEGLFKGIQLHGSISISHLFYADDAMFIREWSDANLKSIVNILKCFFLASGLKINIYKSQVLGVGIPRSLVVQTAASIGCAVMQSQFRYLGVMVGEYYSDKKITWAAWDKVLTSKRNGGLGVSSFQALNRALLLKWVWRFISQDCSLWFRVIQGLYGPLIDSHPDLSSFSDWHSWFSSIRLPINVKSMLEGVFCVAWWVIWLFRNRTIFDETPPRHSVIFDDIVSYSFNWCSSRCSRVLYWETWLKNPHLNSL
nr:RNA-directed DNA polymerase, eukaryota [Tanacetum cinerariifolium]